ncbi:hypothetical protein B0H17DRAFT_1177656 [Mycena rosella]|uniref:Uncharacterized protein n=1 Tax=Mycena rosella TaxID=1033263 RepID=A0AAD7GJ41_MYCRO|nr:hypothetical protein B0H17DRAFT_1177656 [Mycena rosella]
MTSRVTYRNGQDMREPHMRSWMPSRIREHAVPSTKPSTNQCVPACGYDSQDRDGDAAATDGAMSLAIGMGMRWDGYDVEGGVEGTGTCRISSVCASVANGDEESFAIRRSAEDAGERRDAPTYLHLIFHTGTRRRGTVEMAARECVGAQDAQGARSTHAPHANYDQLRRTRRGTTTHADCGTVASELDALIGGSTAGEGREGTHQGDGYGEAVPNFSAALGFAREQVGGSIELQQEKGASVAMRSAQLSESRINRLSFRLARLAPPQLPLLWFEYDPVTLATDGISVPRRRLRHSDAEMLMYEPPPRRRQRSKYSTRCSYLHPPVLHSRWHLPLSFAIQSNADRGP